MIRRLLVFIAPYRLELLAAVLLGLCAVASNVALLAVAAYLVAAAALKPLLVVLTIPMYIVRAGSVMRAVTRYAERLVSHSVTFRVIARLRAWLFAHLLPLSPARLLNYRSGDLLARLGKDLEELENFYVRGIAPLAIAVLVVLGTVGMLAFFNIGLALAALAFMLLAAIGLPWLATCLLRGQGEAELQLRAELHAQTIDGVQGLADLHACGAVAAHHQRLQRLDDRLAERRHRRALVSGLQHGLLTLLAGLALWVTLVLAIPLVRRGDFTGVWLGCLALVVLGAFEALGPVGMAFAQVGRTYAAARRLFEVADAVPDVVDPASPQHLPLAAALTCDEVSFCYPGSSEPVLREISFTLRANGRVAIVGASGSGKSTLASLLLRLYDPSEGRILLGEHTLADYRLDDLHGRMALVSQRPYLFSDTLRHNLLLARPTASASELQEALRLARLDEVVQRLPEGLETWLGLDGTRLSGGERQRVALARAILAQPRLLILDEATANLDPLLEQQILDELMTQQRDAALLLISHRLVGMEQMDEILVLEQGRIVERGTHASLVRAAGPYAALLAAQSEIFAAVTPAVEQPAPTVVPQKEAVGSVTARVTA